MLPPPLTLQRYAHEDLPVLGLGFSSIEQFVAAVPDVLVQHKADSEYTWCACVHVFVHVHVCV